MPYGIVYDGHQNRFVPLKKATVPITDLAVLRGVGIIEVLRTYNGVPFGLGEHLKRLKESEELIGLKKGYSKDFIRKKIIEGLKRFGQQEAVVKILVTGGESEHLRIESRPGLYILFMQLMKYPARQYQVGTKLQTAEYERVFPEAKSTAYLFAIAAHRKSLERGYDEVLYLDEKKSISEGTSYNFAIIKGKALITPDRGILRGVTMETIVKLVKGLGLRTVRRSVRYQELKQADEAFTASTLREVVPVVKVDKIKIGNGKPGKYTKILHQKFREYARS